MKDKSLVIKEVTDLLKTIFDPELPVNIWDLGLIYGVNYNPLTQIVQVVMTLTSPNCPAIDILPQEIEENILILQDVQDVDIKIVWDPQWDKSMMSEEARLELDM